MTRFRKGDVVTIEATIASTPFNMDDGKAKVKIEFPPFNDAYVDPAQLTMVRPEIVVGDVIEWEVGPADRTGNEIYRGEVLAVADDHAWTSLGGGEYATVYLAKARRVEIEPAPAAEAEAA